jgi:hypothetical protein
MMGNGYQGPANDISIAMAMTMASFAGVAIYNSVELLYIIFSTFKRRSGLYFWSLTISTLGIPPYVFGFMFKFFEVAKSILAIEICMVFVVIGWCMMVTGQSVVLYSRLHLVVTDRKKLHWILGMIIADAFICHVPIAILSLASNSKPVVPGAPPTKWTTTYGTYTNVQVTIFFVQELIISAMYVYATAKIFRHSSGIILNPKGDRNPSTRKVLAHLIAMNVIIIGMDVALLAIQYSGRFSLHTIFKGFIYSIKLKMEFRILNQLINLTYNNRSGSGHSGMNGRSLAMCPVKMKSGHGTVNGTMTGIPRDEENLDFGNTAYAGRGGGEGGSVMLNKDQIMVIEETRVDHTNAGRDSGSKLGTRTLSEVDISTKSRSLRRESGESSEVEFAGRGY